MSSTNDMRWQQRFENFGKALVRLEDACAQQEYSQLERAGLVRMYQSSFELSWKTLGDLLFYEGYDVKSPRAIFRKSFEAGFLSEEDCELFFKILESRELMNRIFYEEEAALEAEALIKERFCPLLRRVCNVLEEKRAA